MKTDREWIKEALASLRNNGTHRECGIYGENDARCPRCKELDEVIARQKFSIGRDDWEVVEVTTGIPEHGYFVREKTPTWRDAYDPVARFTGFSAKIHAEMFCTLLNLMQVLR